MFRVVENVRQRHLDWVNFILQTRNWSRNRLSKEAGINPSTLTKFFNGRDGTGLLQSYTIERIQQASGIPAFETSLPQVQRGLSEDESVRYEAEVTSAVPPAVEALRGARNGVDPWILRSRALEAAGYLPGDILIVDLNAAPRSGDVVCAQVYDRAGKAETVMRVYEHPFLVAATFDPSLFKPLLVDNDRVQVRGVVVASFRERRAAA